MSGREPTPGEVYDYAVRRLGLGDYDDVSDTRVHWQYRAKQIGLLKRAMSRNGKATPANVMRTVDWCVSRGKHVETVFRLVWWVDEALADWLREEPSRPHRELENEIAAAIDVERAFSDPAWLGRLARASGPARAEVLAEWRLARAQ